MNKQDFVDRAKGAALGASGLQAPSMHETLDAVWPEFERLQERLEWCDKDNKLLVQERDELLAVLKVIATDYGSVYVGHLAREAIRKLEVKE